MKTLKVSPAEIQAAWVTFVALWCFGTFLFLYETEINLSVLEIDDNELEKPPKKSEKDKEEEKKIGDVVDE